MLRSRSQSIRARQKRSRIPGSVSSKYPGTLDDVVDAQDGELAAHVVHGVGPEGRATVGHHLSAAHLVVDLLGEAREGVEGVDFLGDVLALEQAVRHRGACPVHAALDDVAGPVWLIPSRMANCSGVAALVPGASCGNSAGPG
jgi:hypothetical protein